jgi:lauroyl/myristoyl acyltransferase
VPPLRRRGLLVLAVLRGRLIVLGYRLGWGFVRVLPGPAAKALFRYGADLAYRRGGKGVQRLRANLARVAPDASAGELDALTREGIRSYARYWMEVFRLSVIPPEVIWNGMSIPNFYLLQEAMTRGKGLVIALPHSGNWDHAGAWLVRAGIPFTTVAERLEPAEVFDRFLAFRESLGMEVLPLTGGRQPPSHILAKRLRSGGALCLMADRDLSVTGVPVTFFGETATMPAGPAHLALATGATLLPAVLWFSEDGWVANVHEPVPHTDLVTMTQALAEVFETYIRQRPQDWHMLQLLWQADLPAKRQRHLRGAAGDEVVRRAARQLDRQVAEQADPADLDGNPPEGRSAAV